MLVAATRPERLASCSPHASTPSPGKVGVLPKDTAHFVEESLRVDVLWSSYVETTGSTDAVVVLSAPATGVEIDVVSQEAALTLLRRVGAGVTATARARTLLPETAVRAVVLTPRGCATFDLPLLVAGDAEPALGMPVHDLAI